MKVIKEMALYFYKKGDLTDEQFGKLHKDGFIDNGDYLAAVAAKKSTGFDWQEHWEKMVDPPCVVLEYEYTENEIFASRSTATEGIYNTDISKLPGMTAEVEDISTLKGQSPVKKLTKEIIIDAMERLDTFEATSTLPLSEKQLAADRYKKLILEAEKRLTQNVEETHRTWLNSAIFTNPTLNNTALMKGDHTIVKVDLAGT